MSNRVKFKLDIDDYKYLIEIEGKLTTPIDFILSESFTPKQIEYGTDLKNKEWREIEEGLYVTFFKNNDIFCVAVNKKNINEYSLVKFSINYVDNFDEMPSIDFKNYVYSIEDIKDLTTKFHFVRNNRGPYHNFIRVFNNVFYMILEAVEHFNLKKFYFRPYTSDLEVMYIKMIKTRVFKKELFNLGYKFDGESEMIIQGKKVKKFNFSKEY